MCLLDEPETQRKLHQTAQPIVDSGNVADNLTDLGLNLCFTAFGLELQNVKKGSLSSFDL